MGWKVLIVDDDENLRKLVVEVFQGAGHQVREAAAGKDAIVSAREEKPDLIVMDIMMPGFQGTSAVSALRSDPAMRQIPVIFLTGVAKDTVATLVREDEKTKLLHKPVEPSRLLAAAKTLLPS